MLTKHPSWKCLLILAFEQTEIQLNGRKRCTVLDIHRFIYKALRSSGIENRNPFSWWKLLRIRYLSKGNPRQVKALCKSCVVNLQKPAIGFLDNTLAPFLTVLIISLLFVIIPQTATTSRAPLHSLHILKYIPQPTEDLDLQIIQLPVSSDYHAIASTPEFLHMQSLRSDNYPADYRWIEMQDDQHYSLQLVSSSDEKQLVSFCRKHHICDQAAVYHVNINGRKVVRLLYGTYENHQAAKQAKSSLPLSLQQSNPWARQFSDIKKEL